MVTTVTTIKTEYNVDIVYVLSRAVISDIYKGFQIKLLT